MSYDTLFLYPVIFFIIYCKKVKKRKMNINVIDNTKRLQSSKYKVNLIIIVMIAANNILLQICFLI